MTKEILVATNAQKILDFIIRNPGKQFTATEVQTGTKISKAGVNAALRKLASARLITREKKAKIFLYYAETVNRPLIKQLKILQILLALQPFIRKLQPLCEKMILYGSGARGEDTRGSDVDLLVITNDQAEAEKTAVKTALPRKLQLVFKSPLAFVEMESKDREYFEEVSRGIVLWDGKP